jgi:hypothetical protein
MSESSEPTSEEIARRGDEIIQRAREKWGEVSCRMAYCGKPRRPGGKCCKECSKQNRCDVCKDRDADVSINGGDFCSDCLMTGATRSIPCS